jgi:hypothetical protein
MTKSEALGFHDGELVHHIQARLAWEDTETWEPATVTRVEGPLITIRDSGGGERVYRAAHAGYVAEAANEARTSVFVTDRWRILAFASDDGQIRGIRSPEECEPGSIWNLAQSANLRFVSVAQMEE